MKEGVIMKMRYCFLFIPLLFLSASCESGKKVNTSGTSFLNYLTGIYEGEYSDKTFEVRIEGLDQNAATGERLVSLFVFEKSKSSDIQEFLTRYPDVQSYAEGICKYVKENPNKFSEYDLQTSPSMFYDISADQVWKWDNSLGSLGYFIIPSNASVSSFDINPHYYINLHIDDEYGVTKIHINNKGEAVEIQFFETGFIKKPWNYFVSGPSLEIRKISSETKGVFTQYYNTVNETRELFVKAGEENRSYCDIK